MKLLGAVLVFTGALALGLEICADRRRRVRCLRDLLETLEQLQGELELRAAPLPELLQGLSCRRESETEDFLNRVLLELEHLGEESFAELWRAAAEETLPSLPAGERDELIRLGSALGRMDLEAELRALGNCCDVLRERMAEERTKYPARRRLLLGLSAAAGALVILLLI